MQNKSDIIYRDARRNPQTENLFQRDIEQWRREDYVIGVKISPGNGHICSCQEKFAGCYKLTDAPIIPPPDCDNEFGCTCWWTAIFEDEKPPGGWKVPKKRHPLAGPQIEVPEEPMTEERVRRLAEVLNVATGANIDESHIQTALINSGIRKPKSLLKKVFDWFRSDFK